MPDLKEIYFDRFDEPQQFNNVKHVERLHFHELNMDEIIMLIRDFPKLAQLKFHKLIGAETIDLSALNRERKKTN